MTRELSTEFKRECTDLVIVHGHKHKNVADAMGVGLSSIQRWVSQFKKNNRFAPCISITSDTMRPNKYTDIDYL